MADNLRLHVGETRRQPLGDVLPSMIWAKLWAVRTSPLTVCISHLAITNACERRLIDLLVQYNAAEPDSVPHFTFQLGLFPVKRATFSKQAQTYRYTKASTNHVPTAVRICRGMQVNSRE